MPFYSLVAVGARARFFGLSLGAGYFGLGGMSAAAEVAERWELGNAQLVLTLERQGDQVVAQRLDNRLAGRCWELKGDDFSLAMEGGKVWRAADFALREVVREARPEGQRLRVELSRRGAEDRLAVVYELGEGDFWVRRHLEWAPSAPQVLEKVEVWGVKVEGRCSFQETGPPSYLQDNVWSVDGKHGFGQPVFLEDTFWGLEFPAGDNHYGEGRISLQHRPGRVVGDRFVSKFAVLGVAPVGQVAGRFRSYIEQGRGRPLAPAVQVDYNTWTTVSPATEANSLELIRQFRTKLFDPYKVAFDSFTLDDGWDEKNSLWAVRASGFPRGLAPLRAALQPMGTALGLWLSPSSGYEHAAWGGKNGYARNATFDWFLCQSDPRYRREMERVVPTLIRDHGIGYFKMDGFCASCDTANHAHHGVGDAAREANVEAFMALLRSMREANPKVYLNPTSGMWASPWWLWQVDSLWCDTYDGTAPALIPSPNGGDGATTCRDALLRRRLAQHPGFDPAAFETLGVYLDPTLTRDPGNFFENWQDNAMMVAGRGQRLLTFYMNPAQFPDPPKDWAFLGAMIPWVRQHAETLAHTEMILGDPGRGEAYGYAHFHGQGGLVVLRNPFLEPRTVEVRLDESSGWTAEAAGGASYVASLVYPQQEALAGRWGFGSRLALELQPYETKVVQIEPQEKALGGLEGVGARELRRVGRESTWELQALPGTRVEGAWRGLPVPQRAVLGGQVVAPQKTERGWEIPLTFAGEREAAEVRGGALEVRRSAAGAMQVAGEGEVLVPRGARASCYALAWEVVPEGAVECRARVDGVDLPVVAIRSPLVEKIAARTLKELPLQSWVLYRWEIPEGRHAVAVSLQGGGVDAPNFSVRAGWWLWLERPLERLELTMEFPADWKGGAPAVLPLGAAREFQREVIRLQGLQKFGAGP